MSELEKLNRKKGSLKASLTNFIKYVEQNKDLFTSRQEQALGQININVIQLRDRLLRMEKAYEQFNELQDDIESQIPLSRLEEQYVERAMFEESYFSITAIAKDILEKIDFTTNEDNVSIASAHSSRSSGTPSGHVDSLGGVKLPVIPLPRFEGLFHNWLEFKETFQSLVHENESLSSIQKYHYLRASLEGNAAQVLKSIEFTSAGYTVAWQSLNERFNNTKLLIHNHIKALFSLETPIKESSSQIRKLVDEISKHLRSLEQLGQAINNWGPLLIFMLTTKLDQNTLTEWEKHSVQIDNPNLEDLKTFLKNRADFLETLEYKTNTRLGQNDKRGKHDYPKQRFGSKSLVSTTFSCYYCGKDHSVYTCEDFLNLSIKERIEFISKNKLCLNCLRPHAAKKCKMGPCRKCQSWHNTLLHQDNDKKVNDRVLVTEGSSGNEFGEAGKREISLSSSLGSRSRFVILSTAKVRVLDKNGKASIARALLDSGSMSSFITTDLCERLGLSKTAANIDILGISNSITNIRHKCEVHLSSLQQNFKAQITCFILPTITSATPAFEVDFQSLEIPENLALADDEFNKPGPIDILIGCDLFWNLLKPSKISKGKNQPTFQDTVLGWIVAGHIGATKANKNKLSCNLVTNRDLQNILTKFWEIEECNDTKPLSQDELQCEKIFTETTKRDTDGRFIVTLPLKQPTDCLGESKSQAQKMFNTLERKLSKNQALREHYLKFMQEYIALGHMSASKPESRSGNPDYFMPHHGVWRETSITTRLRVVFNASSPSSNGISLNNLQHVGPVLQRDLLSIILQFRQGRYVVSADCKMMYRQILINPEQRSLQQILWRENPIDELKPYTLNTVTYGHASASFLAIRCLFELANECQNSHPKIAETIKQCFYVDDLLFSTDTLEKAQYLCKGVARVLKAGCFDLRKWYSNDSRVLQVIKDNDESCGILEFGPHENAKTLGLTWSCHNDKLSYSVDNSSSQQEDTKRQVLSLSAKIFDPLGLLSPCIIMAKMLMQTLWAAKLGWDDPLPPQVSAQWLQYKSAPPNLNALAIRRQVTCEEPKSVELHGFADASERAYGACLYVRSIDANGAVHIHLFCAKSKVAPLKTLSIPRLELCAALLLAKLAEKVKKSVNFNFSSRTFWTDSTIVLAWLQSAPNLLKVFVATRVASIQHLTTSQEWRYVPTSENPADYVSRGLQPSQILELSHWWHGPEFLKQPSSAWPFLKVKVDNVPELKPPPIIAVPTNMTNEFPFENFSKLLRLERVTAYILRFTNNCLKQRSQRISGPLTFTEFKQSRKVLIKASQRQSFPNEVSDLEKSQPLKGTSRLLGLSPYLDSDKIIRVGGRLELSELSPDKRHPIVLHSSHHFTKLLFSHEHVRLLHAGPQALLAIIREEFWPISGRNLARSTVRKCLRCFRFRPDTIQPIMANLPRARTIPSPPFHVTGLDYAGPFLVKQGLSRKCKLEKCYVGLFVCFSTKALHLELISSLTTEAFLQAFRRFFSRKGRPLKLVSDNGKNFIGADRAFKRFLAASKDQITSKIVAERIDWQFICPYSPHMGGLWESGVKSVKHHLKRVLANAHLSFEEFTTALTQIEAILNSRPLCPLSSEPSDLTPLTPAHFLIGRPLTAAPDENLEEEKINRLTRFQLVQRLSQHFWKRWQREYLVELQQRRKWKTDHGQLSEGLLVLIKDEQALPTEWRLGRIVELHRGPDGVARVASIRTSTGVVRRSFPNICPLPVAH